MYRHLIAISLLLFAGFTQAAVSLCPVTSGAITLNVSTPRSVCISPCTIFFDATGSTDSASLGGANNVYQDAQWVWNYSDPSSVSGKGNWQYGSHSAYSGKNISTGFVGAHLYITTGSTLNTVAIVTMSDPAGNSATCGVSVTVYDPTTSNGFPGTSTTCVAQSTTPVAGSGGCPAGAGVATSTSSSSAISSHATSGKRVLFHCGDTFTGGGSTSSSASIISIGAYGGCENTQTGRPIFSGGLNIASSDTRVADIDFESTGSFAVQISGVAATFSSNTQGLVYNTNSNGNNTSYYVQECSQCALVQVVQTGMGTQQGTYFNFAQNNCVNTSLAYNCGGTPSFTNINYGAIIGSFFNGAGASNSGGIETVRMSANRLDLISNSTFENANTTGAVLKFHSGNGFDTQCIWLGQYSELNEISDNIFSGASGAELVEIVAQNQVTDERLRNIIVERNYFFSSAGNQLLMGAMNSTVRNNVFNNSGATIGQRGYEYSSNNTAGSTCSGTGTTSAPVNTSFPQFDEFLNNTCYSQGSCARFATGSASVRAANNSFAQNNLIYLASAVTNTGTANTVSNNSALTSANPGFTKTSGAYTYIYDFKPTANDTGATTVPVMIDALGVPWAPYTYIGAVHP